MRLVDQVLIGRARRLKPGVDPRPVVRMVAVIVQATAVLHRRGDPDRGEAQIADVVEPLDQAAEVAPPVRVDGLAGRGIEADTVAAKEVIARIPVIETGRDDKVDGLFAEIGEPFGHADVVVETAASLVSRPVNDEEADLRGASDRDSRPGQTRRGIALQVDGRGRGRLRPVHRVIRSYRRRPVVGNREHGVDRIGIRAVGVARRNLRPLQIGVRVDRIKERADLAGFARGVDPERGNRRRLCNRDRAGVAGRCPRRHRPVRAEVDRIVGVGALKRYRLRRGVDSPPRSGPDHRNLRPLRVFVVPGVVGVKPALSVPPQVTGLPPGPVVDHDARRFDVAKLKDKPAIAFRRHRGPGPRRAHRGGARIPVVDIDRLPPIRRPLEMDDQRHGMSLHRQRTSANPQPEALALPERPSFT